MDNKKYSTEDIRGMLDIYSPEQQMEIDAKTIRDGAKAITDASTQIQECLSVLPSFVVAMQKATLLHIPEETKTEIIQVGKDVGISASKAFNENIAASITAARRETKHVSIPATFAYCLFYLFIALLTFAAVILLINGFVWHNGFVWKLAVILFCSMALVTILTIIICYRGWL